jgi:hypothetical protein
MSLTRDEWAKMWESIKTIEQLAKDLRSTSIQFRNRNHYSESILDEISEIKEKIQSVIGQME